MTANSQPKIYRLDITVWIASTVICAAILAVLLIGSQVEVRITLDTSSAGGGVGPLGPLIIRSSDPLRPDSIPSLASIDPPVLGHFDWLDSKTARYFPGQPFQPNVTYTLQMKSGVAGVNGQRVRRKLIWTFRVRSPLVVYITSNVNTQELWTVGLDGASPKQITHTNNSVFDFDAAPDGDTVAYSAYNEQKGLDLWLIDRDGGNAHRLLDCGKDRCQAPVWSPDSTRIAYSRQSAGLTQNGPLGAPRPWLANVQTGETSPVYTDTQIIGYGASWSPDGKWLASSDGIKGEIHLLDLDTRKVISFSSNTGVLGSWSPDSRYMLYTNIVSGDTDPRTVVMQADLTTGAIITLFGETPVTCKNLILNEKAGLNRLFWTRQVQKTPGSVGEQSSSMSNLTVMTTQNAFIAR